jgi:hypothetical protein
MNWQTVFFLVSGTISSLLWRMKLIFQFSHRSLYSSSLFWGRGDFRTLYIQKHFKPGVAVYICNPSIKGAEAGGSWVWGQPEQKTCVKKKRLALAKAASVKPWVQTSVPPPKEKELLFISIIMYLLYRYLVYKKIEKLKMFKMINPLHFTINNMFWGKDDFLEKKRISRKSSIL